VKARARAPGLPAIADAVLAFCAGIAFFLLLAAAIPVREHTLLIVLWGGIALYALLRVSLRLGPLYGAPLAIATGFAFDSFYIPPTRDFSRANWQNWLVLGIYVGLGVLIGLVAARARRRGEASELARGELADEQAALRRVATLVAEGMPSSELFGAVAREVGTLLDGDFAGMIRYEDDATVSTVATWAAVGEHPAVPARWAIEPGDPAAMVADTRRPARVDDWAVVPGPIAAVIREQLGVSSSVGCPIVVEGQLWGAVAVHSKRALLPPATETRIVQFADLVATAIANADARSEVARLAREQAALRRVATLVAKEAPPEEIFGTVAEEAAKVLRNVDCTLARDEGDGTASIVAVWGPEASAAFPLGRRIPLDGEGITEFVLREGRPRRLDDYSGATGTVADDARERGATSAVGCPIVVGGRTWGAIVVATYRADEVCPPETETRLAQFADLVATAIANAEARVQVERLAEEQAALRRVATLVAEGAPAAAVFDAVVAEMEGVLDADQVALSRYEPGDETTVVAHCGAGARGIPPGSRVVLDDPSVTAMVRRSERPERLEASESGDGPVAERMRRLGARTVVGAPIIVEGRLWGVITAVWTRAEPPTAEIEQRMAKFAQLLDTAIANADSRDQLTASRARLLTAADDARRRVVRDLHDGAQQRLVHSIVTLKLAQRALRSDDGRAQSFVDEALEHAQESNAELRELAHGILPAVLTRGGLPAGIDTVVARVELPVEVDVTTERFPREIEASAYFIVAEALTNVVKHSLAARADVTAFKQDGLLHVEVHDDGIGGADPGGHGLVGLADRATALGGLLRVESPAGGGTLVAAVLPISGG
jgi:signal transduction histidine kinase/uncharacterized protein YoaH (UPF0181 family)